MRTTDEIEADKYKQDCETRMFDSAGISTERHAEICQAGREGRCVPLPPKDTIVYGVFQLCNKSKKRVIKKGRPLGVLYGGEISYIWDYVPATAYLISKHFTREAAEAALKEGQE